MNDFNFRRLLENTIHMVILDANDVLKHVVVPGYYIPNTKTLRISSTLRDKEEMVRVAYAALIHHLHPKTPLEICKEYAREIFQRLPPTEIQWAMEYLKQKTAKFLIM